MMVLFLKHVHLQNLGAAGRGTLATHFQQARDDGAKQRS